MKNKWLTNPPDVQIQGLLDRYMRSRIPGEGLAAQTEHLDDDSLAAFIEGNLGEWETKPLINHLVGCSFCRHVTAELIKLDLAFAEEEIQTAVNANQPSRISEVLSSLLSRIFGTNDGAVFAHQEKEEKTEETEKPEDSEK
ncbi:MAG: hypothetical protein LH472_13155 [Pyrinomonadaceae bacterium]|nr:hypothetical protein [Pyrinomonadaceae bacterium]